MIFYGTLVGPVIEVDHQSCFLVWSSFEKASAGVRRLLLRLVPAWSWRETERRVARTRDLYFVGEITHRRRFIAASPAGHAISLSRRSAFARDRRAGLAIAIN